MFEKIKKRMQEVSDAAQNATAASLPDNWLVNEEIKEKRWNICQNCEHLYRPTSTCKLCGCFMQVKTGLSRQSCPVKKWTAEIKEDQNKGD